MGDVISLDAYRAFKQVVKLGKPCKRPFHRKRYVVINPKDHFRMCAACGVKVQLTQHPTMSKPKWYG
jgi:hypothetical protein